VKLTLPHIPAWLVVVAAVVAGAASVGAEMLWPRHAMGPALEEHAGFYAGAGFLAGVFVLAGAWIARLLRDAGETADAGDVPDAR
jgi:hypothetical protein